MSLDNSELVLQEAESKFLPLKSIDIIVQKYMQHAKMKELRCYLLHQNNIT